MKKITIWLIMAVFSMLMTFSVSAAPLDGAFAPEVIVATAKNQIKSLFLAPETPVSVHKSTNSADKAVSKHISDKTMKTLGPRVASMSHVLHGSNCGVDHAYKTRNPSESRITRWNKRPLPVS